MLGDKISDALDKLPEGPVGFTGDGKVAGMIVDVLRDTYGSYMPTQPTDVEIQSVSEAPRGIMYKINVTGAVRKVSEVRAMTEALPGKLNFATDDVEVKSVSKITDRPLRNTYQITILVKDKELLRGLKNKGSNLMDRIRR